MYSIIVEDDNTMLKMQKMSKDDKSWTNSVCTYMSVLKYIESATTRSHLLTPNTNHITHYFTTQLHNT